MTLGEVEQEGSRFCHEGDEIPRHLPIESDAVKERISRISARTPVNMAAGSGEADVEYT